jgi:outer membrane protein assembly factor BamD
LRQILLTSLLFLTLSACSKKDTYIERPVEVLYNQAMDELQKGSYKAAAPLFLEVERQHPYSTWAKRAQYMAGFCFYASDEYDQAVDVLEKFAQLHPGDENVAYTYYLKAMCFYERISDVGRDQKMTEDAMSAFEEVNRRFPGTSYAKDARAKLELIRDHLAGKEMEIGRFYIKGGLYTAAIGRFKKVMQDFQTTSHIEEALYRRVECNLALGFAAEAKRVGAILGHNYPASIWYRYAHDLLLKGHINLDLEPKSWVERQVGGIL